MQGGEKITTSVLLVLEVVWSNFNIVRICFVLIVLMKVVVLCVLFVLLMLLLSFGALLVIAFVDVISVYLFCVCYCCGIGVDYTFYYFSC